MEDRRKDAVTRSDIQKLHECIGKHRQEATIERGKLMDTLTKRMDVQDDVLSEVTTALFATDDKNRHGQAGLMVTARNIDKHISVVCNIFKWTIAAIGAALPILAGLKSLGFW